MAEELARFAGAAENAARKAGAYLASKFGSFDTRTIREKRRNDFVSEVDRESERLISTCLREQFPDHQILGEEGGQQSGNSDYRWIVDPLDGTTNFIRNIPFFCVSIALYQGKTALTGVVFNPQTNELFAATLGQGATLNGQPISVSAETDFSRAFLATGFPHQRKRQLPLYSAAFNDIFYHSAGMRRIGSAALDLCYVAAGRFEAFWELGLNPWDIAAGSLILSEAAGQVSDFRGGDTFLESGFVVASNGKIHKNLLHHLSPYFGSDQ